MFLFIFGSVSSVDVDQKFDLTLFRKKCIEIIDGLNTDPRLKDLVLNLSDE